jgi:hypothetical protein
LNQADFVYEIGMEWKMALLQLLVQAILDFFWNRAAILAENFLLRQQMIVLQRIFLKMVSEEWGGTFL